MACSTLKQNLARLEKEKQEAYLKAAIEQTLEDLSGYKFCILGCDTLKLTTFRHYGVVNQPEWLLSDNDSDTLAEYYLKSLMKLLPENNDHFWKTPYYNEMARRVVFNKSDVKEEDNDPFAWHELCQPFYWEGYFTGNVGYKHPHTMTLIAQYRFKLSETALVEYMSFGYDNPGLLQLTIKIEMSAYNFPDLDLSRNIASKTGKNVYGYRAELKGWNVIRWHGGYSPYGPYPDSKQTFWNAC